MQIRCTCGEQLSFPQPLDSWDVHCRACGRAIRLRGAATEPPDQPDSSDSPALDSAPADAAGLALTPVEVIPRSVREPQAPMTPGESTKPTRPACPRCGATFPPHIKICVHCGIDLRTGRSIITTDETGLDTAYATIERYLRPVSWLIWFGVAPVQSEAFGTKRPFAVWAFAAAAFLVSTVFLSQVIGKVPAARHWRDLALWAGDRTPTADVLRVAYQYGPFGNRAAYEQVLTDIVGEEIDAQTANGQLAYWNPRLVLSIYNAEDRQILAAHERLPPSQRCTGTFEWYQLFSAPLLHGDPFHLIGNFIFLFVFGSRVNALIGSVRTALCLPLLAAASGLLEVWVGEHGPCTSMMGSSGVIAGLAGMYVVLFPRHPVHMVAWLRWIKKLEPNLVHFKFFKLPGLAVVGTYVAFDLFVVALGTKDGVAHFAHLGGFFAGTLLAVILLQLHLANARRGDIMTLAFGPKSASGLAGASQRRDRSDS